MSILFLTKRVQGCILAAALLAAVQYVGAQAYVSAHEPVLGQRAPSFTLKDQNDRAVSLDDLLKKGPVAVIFLRSADWCVYCQIQLIQIQQNLKEIEASGGQVVAISYDSPDKLKRFASRRKISVPLLSDPGSKVIDAYDMRSGVSNRNQAGCSRHGVFILDQKGIVRAKPYLISDQARPVVDALVGALKEAQRQEIGASSTKTKKPNP
jgi:peroxiredoxin